jgi:hypothetical protein
MCTFPIVRSKTGVLATVHLSAAAGYLRIDRDDEAVEQAAGAGPCDPSVIAQALSTPCHAPPRKQLLYTRLQASNVFMRLGGNI